MIVEVIAVGTELLLGQIVNSNVAFVGRRLAEEGFDAHFQVTVGDNPARLVETIRTAAARSDAVILTGGIGPTQDDLTREALCEVAGRRLLRNEDYAGVIRRRIEALGREMPENNLRMADYPEGAEQLPNATGVALGVALHHDGTWFFAVPGVPSEMTPMIDEQVLPRLRTAEGRPAVLRSRVLRTWGLGESQVSHTLDD
ncbi:MAG TPA: molybdopterin-binding protein, partial [Acidimicrobiia bacterium]|nr:molybdopterin-binding protein [Acidimicrobiia bacterium]